MLNRVALMEQMHALSKDLFLDISGEYDVARQAWQRICSDATFIYKVRQITTSLLVPDWWQPLSLVTSIAGISSYSVLAVDGSQVYPDRHQGTSCFLVNIGSVIVHYNQTQEKPVQFTSKPYVFTGQDHTVGAGQDLVDCLRQELEFKIGLEKSRELALIVQHPFVFLFDGSLIFWHLESKDKNIKDLFLNKYITLLDSFYQSKLFAAGYISLPKSKELVNLIRLELCNFNVEQCATIDSVAQLVDSTIAHFFLSPYSHSIVFKSNAKIGAYYPPHLIPHFFYMDVGAEIVRIEIPAWMAQDENCLRLITQIILDQATKGRGYPVALAEAHEQAVIKGPDREFFYHLIGKMGIEQKRQMVFSQKSIKKRGIGI